MSEPAWDEASATPGRRPFCWTDQKYTCKCFSKSKICAISVSGGLSELERAVRVAKKKKSVWHCGHSVTRGEIFYLDSL